MDDPGGRVRKRKGVTVIAAPAVVLREYQERAVAESLALLQAGRRVCLTAPTGAGKTLIAVETALRFGGRVLWVAHRRELIDQAAEAFRRAGEEPGIILAEREAHPERHIQVGSIQTLGRREIPAAELVVLDEAQHSASDTTLALVRSLPGAALLGATATPQRLDGKGLREGIMEDGTTVPLFDALVIAAKTSELVPQYLVEPRIFAAPAPDLSGVGTVAGDFHRGQLEARMIADKAIAGRIVDHWKKYGRDRLSVIFATGIAHSQQIAAALHDAGCRIAHLDGETALGERARILEDIRERRLDAITNCFVLGEGWDLPALGAAFIARPTKSLTMHLQMIGRVSRITEGKSDALIFDHAGNTERLGHPLDDFPWSLDGRAEKPAKAEDDDWAACSKCGYVRSSPSEPCPECGYVPVRKEIVAPIETDQELVEVMAKSAWAVTVPLETRVADYRAWAERGKERGYAEGWAAYRFRDRYGRWPDEERKKIMKEHDPVAKAATLSTLRAIAARKGYQPGWIGYRYRALYGEWPDKKQLA